MTVWSGTVCFIACHGGSSDHFAVYAEALEKNGCDVHIYAEEGMSKKFKKVQQNFSLKGDQDALAAQIAKTCATAAVVFTDVGDTFCEKMQKALALHASKVKRIAYYDNPENYVPGGYSVKAANTIKAAPEVAFANESLVKATLYYEPNKAIDLTSKIAHGIGYYPVNKAEEIAQRRQKEHDSMRSKIFGAGLVDSGQKVLVYFGGNNDAYFQQAFPKFMALMKEAIKTADLSKTVIVIHQHPAAKEKLVNGVKVKNEDEKLVEAWIKENGANPNAPVVVMSKLNSDEAMVVADAALYYQTSMGPQYVLAGIPTFQIAHETYPDVLVRNGLAPSKTTAAGFLEVVHQVQQPTQTKADVAVVKSKLGIRADWYKQLEKIVIKEK